mgnify:CR=1 FL=1
MPTKTLRLWAKEAGVSIKKAEKYWADCKEEAKEYFKETDSEYWAYVNTCTRGKLGLLNKK